MSYITNIERLGEERGILIGKEEGMQLGKKKGREIERYELAKGFLAEGVPLDVIKKVAKLADLDLVN